MSSFWEIQVWIKKMLYFGLFWPFFGYLRGFISKKLELVTYFRHGLLSHSILGATPRNGTKKICLVWKMWVKWRRIALFSLVCNFVKPYLANYLANLLQLRHIFSPKAPLKGPKVGKRWVLWSQRYLPLSPKLASQKNDKIFNGLYLGPIWSDLHEIWTVHSE